jgi:hypothetical protein
VEASQADSPGLAGFVDGGVAAGQGEAGSAVDDGHAEVSLVDASAVVAADQHWDAGHAPNLEAATDNPTGPEPLIHNQFQPDTKSLINAELL